MVERRTSTRLRSWLLPSALLITGAYGWACTDDPDLSNMDASSGGEDPTVDAETGTDDPTTGGTAGSTTGTDSTTTTGSNVSTTGGSEDVTRADVLASIANNLILPSTESFAVSATELQNAIDAYATVAADDPVAAGPELSAAQDAWQATTLEWQRLEVMQIGPAASSTSAPGGENLRDEIYSWPTIDTCAVDRRIVSQEYNDRDFFPLNLVTNYGLDALEYLLFIHNTEHTCPANVQLDGPWTGLGFEEIERRRAEFAGAIAAELTRRADQLTERWSPEGGNYVSLLANPGDDSPFPTEAAALDDVFRAMFYIDKQTKDGKLAIPLGLLPGCAEAPCPDLLEVPHGQIAADAIAENLEGLKFMVWGGTDPGTSAGFDDLLINADQEQIAIDLLGAIDQAIATARAFDQPLQQAAASDLAAVEELHADVKAVTDILKGPFVMALMLTIPAEGAGDAD